MIRSNIGNIVTNANQIFGVAATTSSQLTRNIARADESLNNVSVNPYDYMSDNEKYDYVQKRKQDMLDYTYGENDSNENIDNIMSEIPELKTRSEQAQHINKKIKNDFKWLYERNKKDNEFDIIDFTIKRGNNNNADV